MVWIAALLTAVIATERGDVQAALADRQTLPAADHPFTYYVSYSSVLAGSDRAELVAASRLMIASTSRQIVLERSAPVPVTETLARIDLRDLRWDAEAWLRLVKRYPYADPSIGPPLVVRADWLTVQLADANESPAYYELLLGTAPKTRDEWLAALNVDKDADPLLRFGLIEEDSGVARSKVRWLESFPTLNGYAWGTRDSVEITPENDPLEHPDGQFKHDGEEWIVGVPKLSLTTRDRGVLQVYLLSNGQGQRVDKAPVDLVEDSSRFRSNAEIRNPGSCIQCHGEGLNEPSENGLEDFVLKGAQLFANGRDKLAEIEAFHLGRISLDRDNEGFGRIVVALTGMDGEQAASAFRRSVERFDDPLELSDVARELGVAPEAARNAIANQTAKGRNLSARVVGLAHGRTITREAFEERYHELRSYCDEWEAR
ncbi:hypothetical protein K2D_16660 [Planctomycetes bacterium K2D]|nr:hypothetical protein K2D_16660 [Planctomycetes bacterium K2D]